MHASLQQGSRTLLALLASLLGMSVFLWLYGVPPQRLYHAVLYDVLAQPQGLAETVRMATPLLLAGVGLVVAFRAQCWNIGAEGQLLLGAMGATWVALFVPLPAVSVLPAMFVAGCVAGALWASVPALLKNALGVNDVLTTLMLNYIALYLGQWLIHGPWKGQSMRGFAYTELFPPAAWLPVLAGTRVHWPTALLALLLALATAVLLQRTHPGFAIRAVGENPSAARYAGISVRRTTWWVMLFSGGAAGLAGVGEVAGIHHRFFDPAQIASGYGYTAIIVAWLARGNAFLAIGTALFMGLLFACGDVFKVTLQLPFQVIDIMNGLLLLCLISSERLVAPFRRV